MEKAIFFDRYRQIFQENSLEKYISEPIMDKMYRMVQCLLQVNKTTNLTAITDWESILIKHLADSCTVLPYLPSNAKVCDVGCGGGFPSIPIAIARPDITVTGIDSTGKKVNYINSCSDFLELNNLSAICGRAEDLAKTELRESFDVVTARAVASLPVLCELCIPFVRIGGTFCAMKGKPDSVEIQAAESSYKKLGAPLSPAGINHLSLSGDSRIIIVAKKKNATPTSYPRPYPQIKKKPL